MRARSLLGALLFFFSVPACAQVAGFFGYGAGANEGVEFALGYTHKWDSETAISVYPLQWVAYETPPSDRYREETFSNGQTVCRDRSNGQFADKEKCEPSTGFEYTPSIEVIRKVAPELILGIGYRGGETRGGYGVVSLLPSGLPVSIGARIGGNYLGLFIGSRF